MKIESNIPLPPDKRGGAGKTRQPYRSYPFEDMEIGDSFHVPTEPGQTPQQIQLGLAVPAKNWAHYGPDRAHIKFTTRQTETGARIWRIS